MPLVFLGSGEFGVPTLRALHGRHRLLAIVTQPDRAAGRGGRPRETPVAAWAREHAPGVRVFKVDNVNEPPIRDDVRAIPTEAWVVIAFGQRLGRELLDGRFAVNLHASLLPRWRGAAPIHAAILAGDHETGNSVITLAERMDAGLVLAQSRREITPELTTGELHDLLAADGTALVDHVLDAHARGSLSPSPQDERLVTLAKKLSRADAWVKFEEGAEACRRRIHGMNPWPGVFVRASDESLKLLRARVSAEPSAHRPGEVLDADRGLVSCGQGPALELLEVQPAGGTPMSFAQLARGRRLRAGSLLIGGPAPC